MDGDSIARGMRDVMEWARRRSRGIAIDYFDIAAAISSGA